MADGPDRYLGHNPSNYARWIKENAGFLKPPICERRLVDSLKLKLRPVDDQTIKNFAPIPAEEIAFRGNLETANAFLLRERREIWVYESIQFERKRMSVAHECGHFVLPWHNGVDYFCSDCDLESGTVKILEREAFGCGSFILMPTPMFVDDMLSLDTGFDSITQLAHRYVVSKEATSIHYARVHPGHCAVLLVEPNDREPTQHRSMKGQVPMPMHVPINDPKEPPAPLRVKYCSASHRFPKFIPAGTGIREGNIIFDSWNCDIAISGEIQASVFGSTDRITFYAECRPVWNTRTVQVLLWRPDVQLNIRKEWILQ